LCQEFGQSLGVLKVLLIAALRLPGLPFGIDRPRRQQAVSFSASSLSMASATMRRAARGSLEATHASSTPGETIQNWYT
jgi:hypothetical protein